MYQLGFCLLVPLILFAQSSVPQDAFGSIEGRVTNAQTSDAVADASLHLYPLSRSGGRGVSRQAQTATSQTDGTFRFEAIPPGTYFIAAERDGFVSSTPSGPPQSIAVSAGQQVTNVSVQLDPQAIVKGSVLEENGDPVPGAKVCAFTTYSLRGKAQLKRKSTATANSTGEYRLMDLPPGTYYLAAEPGGDSKKIAPGKAASAKPTPDAAANRNSPAESNPESAGVDLVRTFYPKALDLESATPVEIAAGQDLADTNIQLLRITTYHIRGKVDASLAGTSGQGLTISLGLRNSLASEGMGRIVPPNPDGTFEIPRVTPGSYTLTLTGNDSAFSRAGKGSSRTKFFARQDIDVTAADVNGVVLAAIPPINLTGRVVVEGSENANISRTRVNLVPSGPGVVGGFQNAAVNADGTFSVVSLDPGEYIVRIAGNPSGTYVKSVSFNRQDVTTSSLDLVQGGSGEIDIVLRAGTGEVDGTVIGLSEQAPITPGQTPNAGSMLVMLVPETLAPDGYGVFFGNAPPSGTFTILNVAPGHYRAFALERWSSIWQNPDLLHEMATAGTSVDLQDFAHIQIQLPVTTADQVQQVAARLGLSAQ